jgi:putative hydrolase of the HAD superfamily
LNVVFDLGGVVFEWRPDAIISSVFEDAETRELVKSRIFRHADWVELDRGTLSLDHAIDRGAERTGLPRGDVKTLMDAVPKFLLPIEATIELIRAVKTANNKLFVLSNMHFASISYLERNHGFWDLFDGMVISCRIRKVKPEIDIYQHLLAEYELDAGETVFIDDLGENLEAASSLGIHTIRFVDASQCRQALSDLGCM